MQLTHFVQWNFNVASAPNRGGMWERLVSCVKKTIGLRQITYIELQTLISEVEVILNNRPLWVDYGDDTDKVLTPNPLVFWRRLEMSNYENYKNIEKEEKVAFSRRERRLSTDIL